MEVASHLTRACNGMCMVRLCTVDLGVDTWDDIRELRAC